MTGVLIQPRLKPWCFVFDRINTAKEKFINAFIAMRDSKNKEQEAMWDKVRELQDQVNFIDPRVLEMHMTSQKLIMLQSIGGVIKIARDKGKVDCGALKQTLRNYIQPPQPGPQ